ncbi:MAG: cytochrome c3 family protein [Chloroflexota bacterium]|nr:cytochrome c3 family protein [Chloroflexota bacterium]
MLRKLILLLGLAGALAAVLAVGSASAGISDIFNSKHDLGSAGNPTCKTCHIPHDALGDYLWAQTPGVTTLGGDTGPLCFSCHDGGIAQEEYIFAPGTVNHPMGADTHLYTYHDPSKGCAACHDPHAGPPDFKFTWDLMNTGKPQNPDNANVCLSCHSMSHATRGLNPSHAFNVEDPADNSWRIKEDPDTPLSVVQMTSPLPGDQTFDPDAGNPEGTRLWDSATPPEPVADGQSGKVGCMTCHSPHGAVNEELNTMEENDGLKHTPICENCHQ